MPDSDISHSSPSLHPQRRNPFARAIILCILLALVACYACYSCRRIKAAEQNAIEFLAVYNQTTHDFDKALTQRLKKEMDPSLFISQLKEHHLPALNDLQCKMDALPGDARDMIVGFEQSSQILERELKLAELILDTDPTHVQDNSQRFFDLLNEINTLRQAIQTEIQANAN